MTTIHTVLVDPAEEARDVMATALGPDEPWMSHDSLPQVAQSIDAGSVPAVVLVGPGVVHDDTIMLAQSIQDERLPVRIIQFTKVLDPDRIRDAMRAGMADVIEVGSTTSEVSQAVGRARRDLLTDLRARVAGTSAVEPPQPTPIIALAAGKGGVGTSLVTTNVAVAMSHRGSKVALVDLDTGSGDLAIMLQRRPSLTILDAMDRAEHLDLDAVSGYLTSVNDDLHLLAAPLQGGDFTIPATPFMSMLGLIAETVDVILIDLGQSHAASARAVLAEASKVVVVTTCEVTAVRGTRRVLHELDAIGVSRSRVRLVVNQADLSTGLSMADLSKALDRRLDASIAWDKGAAKSVNHGRPLVGRRRSKAGQALTAMADELLAGVGIHGGGE